MPQVQVLYRPPANSTPYGLISVRGFLFSVPGRNDSFPLHPKSRPPHRSMSIPSPFPLLQANERGIHLRGPVDAPPMPHAFSACFFRFLSTGSGDVKKRASRSKYVSPDPIFFVPDRHHRSLYAVHTFGS